METTMTGKAEYLTVKEVAAAMAVRPATVRAWLRSGRLQGVRIGRAWRVPASAVKTVPTTAEILDRLAERLGTLPPDRLEALMDALGGGE